VLNTDAEGRLVLADALAYAVAEVKPDAVVDMICFTEERAREQEADLLESSRTVEFPVDVHVIKNGPIPPEAVKNIEFVTRRPGMALEPFRDYWRNVHGPIASRIPTICRYEQFHASLIAYEMGLGKTICGIAIVEELLDDPAINFALIIVPSGLRYQWAQAIAQFTDVATTTKKVKKEQITIPTDDCCIVVDGDPAGFALVTGLAEGDDPPPVGPSERPNGLPFSASQNERHQAGECKNVPEAGEGQSRDLVQTDLDQHPRCGPKKCNEQSHKRGGAAGHTTSNET
jgi:hypothetical protein